MSKKNLVCVIFLLLLSVFGFSQNTFVPDDNFEQALIDLGYDSGPLDDYVPTANINSITDLDVGAKNISDLTGIEDFLALEILNCENNLLTNLNVTGNINLTQLFCNDNLIMNLDVTLHPSLEVLWCFNNQLSTLNTSQNTSLRALRCESNNLTSLDVSNNSGLVDFVCENNQIAFLDVSNISLLNEFRCGNNLLSNLDVSNNTSLTTLYCEQNFLNYLNVTNNGNLITLLCFGNQLTELDLTQNSSLTSLNCSDNQLCSLNIDNGNNNNIILMDFNLNSDLNCVVVDNPNADHTEWVPVSFSNYANTTDACSNFVLVDDLDDFIGTSYTLPYLSNGNYFTESGASGIMLNAGDIIDTSQTIYIYNENTCDSNESSFNVIITEEGYYIPKYFTPNNDGNHDLWLVKDFNNNIQKIEVFDRYGKFIKYLQPDIGWNGTFNGKPLESNDYWYVITFTTGGTIRGHFTLKR